jgi:hypothetical protein
MNSEISMLRWTVTILIYIWEVPVLNLAETKTMLILTQAFQIMLELYRLHQTRPKLLPTILFIITYSLIALPLEFIYSELLKVSFNKLEISRVNKQINKEEQ